MDNIKKFTKIEINSSSLRAALDDCEEFIREPQKTFAKLSAKILDDIMFKVSMFGQVIVSFNRVTGELYVITPQDQNRWKEHLEQMKTMKKLD